MVRRSRSTNAEVPDAPAPRPPQPRPGDVADPRTTTAINADVLEVIAEYACATVDDACALRAANKGYRRAVDTTVRRLVHEDQPEVRTDSAAALRIHRHQAVTALDAVRIAFTCDTFENIARLVVVAFALDGAKDELHEGGECGPRPVATSELPQPTTAAEPATLTVSNFRSTALPSLQNPMADDRPHAVPAAAQCLANVSLTPADVTEGLCTAITAAPWQWRFVTRFAFMRAHGNTLPIPSRAVQRVAQLLAIVGAQLTHLLLDSVPAAICPPFARCSKLTHLRVTGTVASAALAKALIASGAPLVSVDVNGLTAADTMRLLQAVPTITRAATSKLAASALPPAVRDRMTEFNTMVRRSHTTARCTALLPPSPHLETANLVATSERFAVCDVTAAFPRLRRLAALDIAPSVDVSAMLFPASLESIRLVHADPAVADRLLQRLGSLGPAHLPRLADIVLHVSTTSPDLDLAPLGAFAATLTNFALHTAPYINADHLQGANLAAAEGALSVLTRLETLQIPSLMSARCLLGGNHRRLRYLWVLRMNYDGATFERVVAACPRLMRVQCRGSCVAGDAITAAPGWKATQTSAFGKSNAVLLERTSFV